MKMERLAGLSHKKMIKTLRKSYFIQKNKDNTFIRLILEEDKKETLLPAINENNINIKETNLEKFKTSDNFFNAIGY